MNKGLTIRTGQTHVNRWSDDLVRRIEDGQIDPSFVITLNQPRALVSLSDISNELGPDRTTLGSPSGLTTFDRCIIVFTFG